MLSKHAVGFAFVVLLGFATAAPTQVGGGGGTSPPPPPAPYIYSFSYTTQGCAEGKTYYLFQGLVAYPTPADLMVHIWGVTGERFVPVAADGSFTFSLGLRSSDEGAVYAQAISVDGDLSNIATDMILN